MSGVRRTLLALVGVLGLVFLTLNMIDGEFHWRGNSTTRVAEPAGFWFLIVMNGSLFIGLLLLSIFGRWSDGAAKSRKPPLTLD